MIYEYLSKINQNLVRYQSCQASGLTVYALAGCVFKALGLGYISEHLVSFDTSCHHHLWLVRPRQQMSTPSSLDASRSGIALVSCGHARFSPRDAVRKRDLCRRAVAGCHFRILSRNGYRYGHSCHGIRIGNRNQAFEWYHF